MIHIQYGTRETSLRRFFGFSIDVEKLCYSIPMSGLFCTVRHNFDNLGPVEFMNMAGVPANNFLGLLQLYLSSTVATFDNSSFVKKDGLCIGSCIATILSDIF